MNILAYIEKIKRENESPRITAQEPRNMYAGGQLVRNTVDGSRPGYAGKGSPGVYTKGGEKVPLPKNMQPLFNQLSDEKYDGRKWSELSGSERSNFKANFKTTKWDGLLILRISHPIRFSEGKLFTIFSLVFIKVSRISVSALIIS